MKRIFFICTGNTCRSPMAEIMLRTMLKQAQIKGIVVRSAGLQATDGKKMSDNSRKALKRLGYLPYGFKARLLTPEIINKADMLICMTDNHKKAVASEKAYSVNELTGVGEIGDPYGCDLDTYLKTARQLEQACKIIVDRIKKVKGVN